MNKNIIIAIAVIALVAVIAYFSMNRSSMGSNNMEPVNNMTDNSIQNEPMDNMDESEENMDQSRTIVDIAASDERFSTLVKAVEAADLVETLSSEGPFTVFAPTNDAFAKLPEGTLATLLEDKEGLTNVLTYHVVPGVDMAYLYTFALVTLFLGLAMQRRFELRLATL